jgi:hypothetical protein
MQEEALCGCFYEKRGNEELSVYSAKAAFEQRTDRVKVAQKQRFQQRTRSLEAAREID